MKRHRTGDPTSLNIFALAEHFGTANRAPRHADSLAMPHLRRCLRAGLMRVEGDEVVLTHAGVAAIAGDAVASGYMARLRAREEERQGDE